VELVALRALFRGRGEGALGEEEGEAGGGGVLSVAVWEAKEAFSKMKIRDLTKIIWKERKRRHAARRRRRTSTCARGGTQKE
jgi:hypothetical protein